MLSTKVTASVVARVHFRSCCFPHCLCCMLYMQFQRSIFNARAVDLAKHIYNSITQVYWLFSFATKIYLALVDEVSMRKLCSA